MKKRIFRSLCGVSLLSVLLACLCVIGVLYQASLDSMRASIRDQATLIAAALNGGDENYLENTRATSIRITLVDGAGTVLYDSLEDPANMENHADRPEIAGAMKNSAAEAQRLSDTLATQTYYRALRLENGQVLRVAGSRESIYATVAHYIPLLLLAALLSTLLSAFVARWQTRKITAPLNRIDLENPLANDVYEELAPLLRRMEQQRTRISEQLEQLTVQRREFDAITDNMREGLILVSGEAEVLSINHSALGALEIDEMECVGKHILHLNREQAFQDAVQQGLDGHAAEATLTLGGGRVYRLLTSPVRTSPVPLKEEGNGAVLLLMDITDKQRAEQMRREFTANVSHELKTPLTSISGFAEIMKDGMVKSGDIQQFSERIYKETRRLIALVDDIIRLSRLDEGGDTLPREPVRLRAIAEEVADRLRAPAQERGIHIAVLGEESPVNGVRAILEEMVSNLCDNAVKYNRDGGKVEIRVSADSGGTTLSVSDTGIGIPKEHQDRVFERFYRVDKSHSKETGGTGLGLSIVKHAAIYHHARLELNSEPGEGTEICVHFPALPEA